MVVRWLRFGPTALRSGADMDARTPAEPVSGRPRRDGGGGDPSAVAEHPVGHGAVAGDELAQGGGEDEDRLG